MPITNQRSGGIYGLLPPAPAWIEKLGCPVCFQIGFDCTCEPDPEALRQCATEGHQWKVEGYANRESAMESFECLRCGYSPEPIIYY